MTINVYIERLSEDIQLPTYANPFDSGVDVRAAEDYMIYPQETLLVKTGIKVAIPEGYELQVRPRSGISLNTPLRMANSVGTVDAGYRGEIGVIITNTSTFDNGLHDLSTKGNMQGVYMINKGNRVAQLVLQAVPQIHWTEVQSVADIGLDRKGGFGSTHIK
jgi:dUTP pyrophosphatase